MLTNDESELIKFHESLAREALLAISAKSQKAHLNYDEIAERIRELRDEAAKAKEADLPALFDQINSTKALYERESHESLPSQLSPYFAHMKLKENQRDRDILIGQRTFLDGELPIIDWRHAPIAKIFFRYRVGDCFEEKLPGRVAKGEVVQRTVLTFDHGELVGINTGERAYIKQSGHWDINSKGILPELKGGAGTANRGRPIGTGQTGVTHAQVSALLAPDQYEALTQSDEEPILILGTAGSGKTTIALHRVSNLVYQNPKKYPQSSIGVIVPDKGLAGLSSKLLASLDLPGVKCQTYDDWLRGQAKLHLRRLPNKICDSTPYNVIRMKRHPAMIEAIKALLEDRRSSLAAAIQKTFKNHAFLLEYMSKHTKTSLVPLIQELSQLHQSQAQNKNRLRVIIKFYTNFIDTLKDSSKDREDLLLNHEYLERVITAANGDLSNADAASLIRHSIDQMGIAPDTGLSDIDTERLETIDGHNLIKDAKNDPIYKTIDAEDFTLLMHLERLKYGQDFKWRRKFCHLVIDEAQDMAPLELEVLSMALDEPTSLTVAGDEHQAIDSTAYFEGWQQALNRLGSPQVKAQRFMTAYRSTHPITNFAHKCLGPYAPKNKPKSQKDGVEVARSIFPNEGHAMMQLSEALTDLVLEEPNAYIAVIAKEAQSSRRIFEALSEVPKIRFVEDGHFNFVSGIEVTDVTQVKGLEFDYVIIPDATYGVYTDTKDSRLLFHVAATRAIHQLWVISIGKETIIMKDAK